MAIYKILTHYSAEALSHEVNKLMDSGWHLYGSLCITFNSDQGDVIFAQALTKE